LFFLAVAGLTVVSAVLLWWIALIAKRAGLEDAAA